MAGIYLHIPFCRQACHYCNFYFSTSLNRKNDFVRALLKEMELQKEYIAGESIGTVYFGGGTPSLLDPEELERIMEGLHAHYSIAPDAEITLEANPDDMAIAPGAPAANAALKFGAWRSAGINRLSIGVQSFFEEDLRWMNRAHNAGQSMDAIRLAQEQGFDNISIDLIYGGPTLPDERWRRNVEQAIGLGIPHLSCYALTVEPRTALDHMIREKKQAPVDPDAQARQFLLLSDWLGAAGYEHYEISNFALPGKRSRHNSSYWQGIPYLGLGPSAHAYNGVSRQWNVSNNSRYIDSLLAGQLLFERETLSPVQQLNEYIMISLRTMEGCNLRIVSERFGAARSNELLLRAQRHISNGTIKVRETKIENGHSRKNESMMQPNEWLVLTREGKLLADGIAGDLFF